MHISSQASPSRPAPLAQAADGLAIKSPQEQEKLFHMTNTNLVQWVCCASGSSYGYDAWGAPLWCTGELAETLGKAQPFRYRGYVFDEETGFYYVSSRYYDPEIGRFISPDTTDVLTATPMGLTDKNLYPRGVRSGIRQLQKYNKNLGGGFNLRLELYWG